MPKNDVGTIEWFDALQRAGSKDHSYSDLWTFYIDQQTHADRGYLVGWYAIAPTLDGYRCFGPFKSEHAAIEYAQ